ncbi:MAG: LysR family transcriptional regulator [Albidovulum sp.]
MKRHLPPFSGLIAFHEAVRHGTLTEAARALNVSQPAVSRRIAQLEADLGAPLFDRGRKPVKLTEAGRELVAALGTGFDLIESATDRIRRAAKEHVVTVSGPSGFVAFWLIPRLGPLRDAFPDTVIRIISMEQGEAGRPGDVMIRFGMPNPAQADEVKILGEDVFPAASPYYLSRHPQPKTPEEFTQHTLLTMEGTRRFWYDWPSWFTAVGATMPDDVKQLDFNTYAMAINAALAGQGICLSWSGLLDSFLETGALVRLTGLTAGSERGYFLARRDRQATRPEVDAVARWIAHSGGAG